ncbi:AAA+ superfamily predicted ATPase [Thermocatellispora tengchongensis]|uniref:AAA+ superfamily predicted ATPase n=1 Tax=Thermocatellispora tengchongensis TaxID=1073253 RepID=A0A840PB59_9ACTN|nr:ATP-binding protein [Thermocatellispora tengchongensis]MBB5134417.1 AAA+ superfamily predicted ATPase [Thermocatellispora tengchongensis]
MSDALTIVAVGDADRDRFHGAPPATPLRTVLAQGAYLLLRPLDPRLAERPVRELDVEVTLLAELPVGTAVYPTGLAPAAPPDAATGPPEPAAAPREGPWLPVPPPPPAQRFPEELTDRQAVEIAYAAEIGQVGSFLRRRISSIVTCDKLVVEHLGPLIGERAGAVPILLETPEEEQDPSALMAPRSRRQRQLDQLRTLLRELKDGQVLVIPHLDLLCGGGDGLTAEARDLIELLYNHSSQLILAFADPTIGVPEVLAERFGARIAITGSPRVVVDPVSGEELPLGVCMVTRSEAGLFAGYKPEEFHKYVAGLNPIRLRQAVRYAYAEHAGRDKPTDADLRNTIRGFKARMSASFEVPDVSFRDIGGYREVKAAIADALEIMTGLRDLGDRSQSELMPKGFIFYGPPGTGKTLFAKAIANHLNATIMVVSGPEVTDKYVGEGERKIRELFASARRNAPSVIVFDEFDAIAGRRSERDDGGSRAGNAMVAQLLTELDGFREDVPFLVIGTTNQLGLIDPALLRPSRFLPIRVDLPSQEARREIVAVQARRFGIAVSDELTGLVAEATSGRSGDDIQSIFRDAYVGERLHGRPAADPAVLGELVGRLNRSVREKREETL